jgi:hypothetical protein
MSWDSKPSYPSSALSTVTIKATTSQCYRWGKAAKLRKMARGAFIALAVDTYCLFLDAVADAEVEYDREMHPERWREREGK